MLLNFFKKIWFCKESNSSFLININFCIYIIICLVLLPTLKEYKEENEAHYFESTNLMAKTYGSFQVSDQCHRPKDWWIGIQKKSSPFKEG